MIAILMIAIQMFGLEMSLDDQKTAGLDKLSSKEKQELQKLVDANYDKKPPTSPVAPTPPKKTKESLPTLSENLMNSRYLRLSDGTLWNIRPEDVPIAQGWISAAEIVVAQSGNSFYAYKLTNQLSGSSILARKADKLPPPGSPDLVPSENSIKKSPPPVTK